MKYSGLPHSLLMIRPKSFGYNVETSATNAFQNKVPIGQQELQQRALVEFDRMRDLLLSFEIDVRVFEDDNRTTKPDAIFPNNWISMHPDGKIILYPMMAPNRRLERRTDVVDALKSDFAVTELIDLSTFEQEGKFLEGTGSIIYDHQHKVMYACVSPRTDAGLLEKVSALTKYKLIVFHSVDENGLQVYHTNVMMSIGIKFAVVCLDSIRSEHEQELILDSLSDSGLQVIAISYDQMKSFAGNIFETATKGGEPVVLMSKTAFNSLLPGQLNAISKFSEILQLDIDIIERAGGGGVRCMVAGNYLPK